MDDDSDGDDGGGGAGGRTYVEVTKGGCHFHLSAKDADNYK